MALSCALYDQLELGSIRQNQLRLEFKSSNETTFVVVVRIKDLYVKAGKEYLLTDQGQEYCLDELNSIEIID